MSAEMMKVGMREFREHLPQYLKASSPIAVTRHGETVGFYIPTQHQPENAELTALKKAAAQLETLLLSAGASEEEHVKRQKK